MTRPDPSATARDGRGSLGSARTRIPFGYVVNVGMAPFPGGHNRERVTAPKGYVISDVAVAGYRSSDACWLLARDEDPVWSPPTVPDMHEGTRLPVFDNFTPFFYPTGSIERAWRDIETAGARTILFVNFSGFSKVQFEVWGTFTEIVVNV